MALDREEIIELATVAGTAGGKAVVQEVLTLLGIDVAHPLEMQTQMAHLRFWTNLWTYSAAKIISAMVIGSFGIAIGIAIAIEFHLVR